MEYIIYLIALIFSFSISYLMVPVSIKLANKMGILDNPDRDNRRVHKKPTPRIGGLAMVISIIVSVIAIFAFSYFMKIQLDNRLLGFVLGAIIIATMGFVDDIKSLRPAYKFMFQLVAGSVIYVFGISIVGVKIPFIHPEMIDFGIFAFPITLLWVLGITNAVNLIDGLDGLAAGIANIAAISLLVIFLITGASLEVILLTVALVGATLGFLPYNFNPAKTFMGDTGSNFLGYTLATISIMGMAKGYTLLAIVIPIIIFAVPIFDMLFVVCKRLLQHQKITSPDKKHIHHRLLNRGFSQKQAVLILYTITCILGITAITIVTGLFKQGILSVIIVIVIWFAGYIYSDLKSKKHALLKENEIVDANKEIENKRVRR